MMYFINFGLPEKKSGIEHAELKRLKLFQEHQYPCKIITRDWYRDFHTTANASGVDDSHLLGMFDFFQDRQNEEHKRLIAEDIDFGLKNLNYIDEHENNRYLVMRQEGDQLVARVNYDVKNAKQVVSTELFDGYGNLYRVDVYDSRGFKTMMQWYTPDNKIGNEEWISKDGHIVLRTYNKKTLTGGSLEKTGWWVRDTNQKIYTFDTMDELFEHFLNLVNSRGKNIFILDRSLLADTALTRLKRKAFTVMHLHNAQTGDSQKPMTSVMNNNYEYSLVNIDKYSAVISATQKQTKDVIKRFHPTGKMYTIPVGIVPDNILNSTRVPMADRKFGKIIAVARIAFEKRLDDLVRAVKLVHDKVPEVTLDLYGYDDSTNNFAERKKVEQVIKEVGLENVVTFKGYTNDIESVEDQAQIFGLTSRMEGFNLAIMEAISHGVVGVTYNVNYGPNDIIQEDKNGYVVGYGNYKEMASRILELLQNTDLLQRLSTGAYESSSRYSSDNVWKAWEKLINDANEELEE